MKSVMEMHISCTSAEFLNYFHLHYVQSNLNNLERLQKHHFIPLKHKFW